MSVRKNKRYTPPKGAIGGEMNSATVLYDDEGEDFVTIMAWLFEERKYQRRKYDYAKEDEEHALEGLGDDSWYWERGVLNYTGRVRLFGATTPLGVQALLKLIATLISMLEHLMRGQHVTELPAPGLSSGNLE